MFGFASNQDHMPKWQIFLKTYLYPAWLRAFLRNRKIGLCEGCRHGKRRVWGVWLPVCPIKILHRTPTMHMQIHDDYWLCKHDSEQYIAQMESQWADYYAGRL